jgi:tRNA G46 methylase TrmB
LFASLPWLEMVNPDAEPTEGIMTNFEKKCRKQGKPIYRCVMRIRK